MRRAMVMIATSVLVAACGSSSGDDGAIGDTTSATSTVAVDTTGPADTLGAEPTSTSSVADGGAIASPEDASAALGVAGLPCSLVPLVKDPSPIGPDVEVDEYDCVLGYERLTIGFYDSAEARAVGVDAILGYFGPFMKNFGMTEVSYAWNDAGRWTATLEPATDGFTPEISIPATEAELLLLVAEALDGEVHVVEL